LWEIVSSKDETFGRKYRVNYLKHKKLLKEYTGYMRKNQNFIGVI